jgi:RNA polymerase sigma-70 factor (ECF subfamily)
MVFVPASSASAVKPAEFQDILGGMGDRVSELILRVSNAFGDELLALPDADAHIAALIARAHARRGELGVDDRTFLAYLADRLPESAKLVDLDALHVDDLYFACACARGEHRALSIFEREYVGDLRAAIATVERTGTQRDDILQIVRTRLFVGDADRSPRIADYIGRGRLFSWLRVVVVREALSLLRKPRHEHGVDEIPDAALDHDLELDVFRGMYQREFKQAFATAVSELTPRERNLLRLHLIDGLSIDEIGTAHRTHRTSAARWLRDIRAKLADRTRDLLAQSLRLADGDLDSVMRLVRSRLDLSVSRLLEAG